MDDYNRLTNSETSSTTSHVGTPTELPPIDFSIPDFYEGKNILVAGAGFLGKVLILKLMRECPGIRKIYVYFEIGENDNKRHEIDKFCNHHVFNDGSQDLKRLLRTKVFFIVSYTSKPAFVLFDHELALDLISIFFYTYGTVKLGKNKESHYSYNFKRFEILLNACTNVKAVIYVSTAFSIISSKREVIKEDFYKLDIKGDIGDYFPDKPDAVAEEIFPFYDIHTITKIHTEYQIRKLFKTQPIGIFRPGMLTPAWKFPSPGFMLRGKYNTAIRIVLDAMTGRLRTVYGNPNAKANIVPVDFAANAIIACAWDVACHPQKKGTTALIYNYVSVDNRQECKAITWAFIRDEVKNALKGFQNLDFYCHYNFNIVKSKTKIFFRNLWDLTSRYEIGYKEMFERSDDKEKNREGTRSAEELLTHVTTNDWVYEVGNVRGLWSRVAKADKETFYFDLDNLDWKAYMKLFVRALRAYCFVETTKKKVKKPNKKGQTKTSKEKDLQRLSWAIHVSIRVSLILLIIFAFIFIIHDTYGKYDGTYDILYADDIPYDFNIEG